VALGVAALAGAATLLLPATLSILSTTFEGAERAVALRQRASERAGRIEPGLSK